MKLLFSIYFCLCLLPMKTWAQKAITNNDIVAMKNAKIKEKDILSTIASSKCDFDLTTKGLIALKGEKISDRIIKTMFIVNPPKDEVMTNDDIIKLSNARIDADLVNVKIRSTSHKFDVSPSGLIQLKSANVSKKIINTMMISPEGGG